MLRTLFATAAAALAAGLCAAAAAQTPIPPSAKAFVAAAAQSDQYEIDAGQVAVVQARDPRVRAFARRMIADHTHDREALRRAARASGLPPPPPGLGGDQAKMLSALQGVRGRDFDKAYATQQALAHQQALAVTRSYAAGGTDPNVRRAAQAAVPMIADHLRSAEQLRAALGAS